MLRRAFTFTGFPVHDPRIRRSTSPECAPTPRGQPELPALAWPQRLAGQVLEHRRGLVLAHVRLLHQAVDGLGGVVRLVLERGTVRRSGLCPTVPTSSGTRRHVRRRDVRVRLRRLVLDAWSRRTASRNAAEGAHGRAAAGSFSSGILSRTATAGRSAGGATPRRTRPVSPTVHPSLRPRFSIQPLTTDSSQPTRLGLI